MADDVIHVFDVDEPVPVHPGHAAVYLGDDQGGLLHRRLDDIHADSQAHIAVLVRRGGLDQGHLDRDQPPVKEIRHMGKKEGGVVGHAPVDRFPGVVADEEGVVAEIILEFFVRVRGHPQGPDMDDLGVEKGFRVGFDELDQGLDQVLRLGAGGVDENSVPPVDVPEDLLLGNKFLGVDLLHLPAHFIG